MALRFEGGAYWNGDDGPLSDADVAAIRDRQIDAWEDELAGIAITTLGIRVVEFHERPLVPSTQIIATEFPRKAVRRFSDAFRQHVAESITHAYVFSVGGMGAMAIPQWKELTGLIEKQDRFAVNFVEAIRAGELSERQIIARARQYAGAGTEAFERGKTAMRHFEAPEIPGQLCAGRSRCRCYWQIVTKKTTIEATWRAKGDLNTCAHCSGNAVRWNPLIVPYSEPDVPDQERPGMGDLNVNDFYKDFTRDPSSAATYLEPDGHGGVRFTAERQAFHDQIITDYTEGVPRSDDRTVHMLGGGGGAGKTTMIKSGQIAVPSTDEREAVLVNADEMKNELPEYEAMREAGNKDAARFVHEESSYLAKRLTKAAMENGQDILVDSVGVNLKVVDQARAIGYDVHGYYAFLPNPEDAVDRAVERFKKTGRMPPPEVIREAHARVPQVFPVAAEKLDSIVLYNTSTRDPNLVAHKDVGGELVIDDQAEYDHFISLGEKR